MTILLLICIAVAYGVGRVHGRAGESKDQREAADKIFGRRD